MPYPHSKIAITPHHLLSALRENRWYKEPEGLEGVDGAHRCAGTIQWRNTNGGACPPERKAQNVSPAAVLQPARLLLALTPTGGYSGFRVILLAAPSRPWGQWHIAAFVTGYSGASAADSHRLPHYFPGEPVGHPAIIASPSGRSRVKRPSCEVYIPRVSRNRRSLPARVSQQESAAGDWGEILF